jgi:hypothetical protein
MTFVPTVINADRSKGALRHYSCMPSYWHADTLAARLTLDGSRALAGMVQIVEHVSGCPFRWDG